ncbi:MAG: SWIM zinc finger family protein [Chloroflexota bacterium]|nr:SWIM zinc finger family protein [Chloroflexota bacterium]
MDYGMIGKIEKAKWYAAHPERATFNTFNVEFKGDNSTYTLSVSNDGWDCSCPGYKSHGICPHVMTIEKMFKPLLKRQPLPYAPGQNVVSDVEKAKRYANEPDRVRFLAFNVTFQGDNSDHTTTFHGDGWSCDCAFFASRHVCGHTMAMERILKGMLNAPTLILE